MARTNEHSSADAAAEQPATPKRRRRRIVWDHRRDKYLLLAIFAHMNIKTPNFQEIADMLGNETYSADTLTRRFRVLRQLATEVMEDRHDKGLEIVEEGIAERDHDVMIVDEPAAANPAAQLPITPSSIRSEQAIAELGSPMSETSTPSQSQRDTHPRGPQAESRHPRPSKKEQMRSRRQQEPRRPGENRAKDRGPAITSPNSDRLNGIRHRIRQRNHRTPATAVQRGVASEPSNERLSARPEPTYIPLGLNPRANSSRNWSAIGPAESWQPYSGNRSAYGGGGGGGGGQAQFVFPSIEH